MDFDGLIGFFEILAKLKLRKYVGFLILIIMAVRYIKNRHYRKKITLEEEDALIEATYQKDDDGLYPWEADTNDHPDRVGKNSLPIKKTWGAQRGKW